MNLMIQAYRRLTQQQAALAALRRGGGRTHRRASRPVACHWLAGQAAPGPLRQKGAAGVSAGEDELPLTYLGGAEGTLIGYYCSHFFHILPVPPTTPSPSSRATKAATLERKRIWCARRWWKKASWLRTTTSIWPPESISSGSIAGCYGCTE